MTFQMLLSLSAVVLLMAGISYVIKRFTGISTGAQNRIVNIDVLGQKHLNPKRSIQVIRVSDTVFVIGSSEQGMQLIGQLDDESLHRTLEQYDAEHPQEQKIVLNAKSLLTRLTKMGTVFPMVLGKQK
jgi:flagellar biogenesis protein FliO